MGMLRLFLALSVIVHHIPQTSFRWLHASVAVLCFFMVSGFYMTLVINEKYSKVEGAWIAQFYLARLFRIFPVYLAMLLFMVVWYLLTDTSNVFSSNMGVGFWGQLSLVLMNLFIVGQDWHQLTAYSLAGQDANAYTAFIGEHFPKAFFDNSMMMIGQAWSLSIELLFYLLAPFVVLSYRRIIALLLASLLVRVCFWHMTPAYSPLAWGYFFLPSVLCFFLMGSLAYYLYRYVIQQRWAMQVAVLVNLLVASVVAYVMAVSGYPEIFRSSGYDTLASWLLYLGFAACLPFVFLLWKNNRIDRWLGDFSYPVYIVHGLIIGLLLGRFGLEKGSDLAQFSIIGVSLLVAWFACFAIDTPVDKWRHRRFATQAAPITATRSSVSLRWASGALAVVCLYIAWLTTYTPLQAPPARLVKVEEALRYNIVAYDKRFFAVPFGTAIKWGGRDYEQTAGLIIGSSQDEVAQAIRNVARAEPVLPQVSLPRLVKVEQALQYNIVSYNSRFYGIRFGVPIEWGGDNYEQTPSLIIGNSQEEVRLAIYRQAGEVPQ